MLDEPRARHKRDTMRFRGATRCPMKYEVTVPPWNTTRLKDVFGVTMAIAY